MNMHNIEYNMHIFNVYNDEINSMIDKEIDNKIYLLDIDIITNYLANILLISIK